MTAYDWLNDMASIFLAWFPPFYLGRTLVKDGADLRKLLRFMVLCGLVYSIPILIVDPDVAADERLGLRLSPVRLRADHPLRRLPAEGLHAARLNVALFMTVILFAAIAMYRSKVPLGEFWTPGRASLYLR
ncbi:MAG: hypothetical protein H6719_32415 [Sandaracinaceae bacterium]|nr:hypothetical protein [Sandaracinaceae bacterium]